MDKLTQHLETLQRLKDCELHTSICDCEICQALTFFIEVGEKLNEENIEKIIFDNIGHGLWKGKRKDLAHSILTELTQEEKK